MSVCFDVAKYYVGALLTTKACNLYILPVPVDRKDIFQESSLRNNSTVLAIKAVSFFFPF
jgi:hypothetical protein